MQHHTHLTRPPHMRSAHTNNIQIHPAPVPPTQLAPKLPQTSNAVPQSTSMRDHQSRLGKPHLTTAVHNQTTQMQKIRQQHQHLSYKNNNNNNPHHNNNNNNNNNNNPNYQQYNHLNVQQQQQQEPQPHMGVLQQQQQSQHQTAHRNVPPMHHQQKSQHQQQQQQQQQHHNVLHMKNQLPHHQQQQHQLQQLSNPNIPKQSNQHQQQYPTYGYAGNKTKYNNNNNNNTLNEASTNYSTPKTILQNPNRLLTKPSSQITATSTATSIAPITSPSATTKDFIATEVVTTVRNIGESNNLTSNTEISTQNQKHVPEFSEITTQENLTNAAEVDSSNEVDIDHTFTESQIITSSACENSSHQLQNTVLSNVDLTVTKHTKEKTPMCLVNELARFNKITHQYRLTGEKGPAHCKRFTVTLKLGDEEYTAEGFKIKKAQHLAAAQAIEKTAYKHPIPKGSRNNEDGKNRPYIMPTVELNALAMKLGQPTYYLFDPRQMPSSMSPSSPSDLVDIMHDGSGIPTHHYGGPRPPMPHPTSAHGHGGHIMPPPPSHSRMMHDPPYAARRNYDLHGGIYPPPPPPPPPPHMQHHNPRSYLPHRGYPPMNRYHQRYPLLPPPPAPHGMPPAPHHMHPHFGVPTSPYKITLIVGKQKFVGVGRTMQQAKHDAAARALQVLKTKNSDKSEDELDDSLDENDAKSPISQVHEAAVKRSMQVHFKILREEGPAHMRNFITACIVGSIVTEGEGHGKKISKKRAAEKMLAELEKLPPLTPIKSPIKRIKAKTGAKANISPNGKSGTAGNVVGRRGKRDSISSKSKDIEKNEEDDENPITKLIQIQQNRKDKEPIFEFLSKSGNERLRRREFIVEVTAQGMAARGTGRNKKLAKRNAAENLLKTLAEAANSNGDESATKDANDSITSSQAIVDKPKEKVDQKSTISSNEKLRTSLNIINTTDVPIVSTTAGQVPGILILRQNKKSAAKKKEVSAITAPVKSCEIETTKTDAPAAEATLVVSDIAVTTSTTVQPVITTTSSTPLSTTVASNTTTMTTTTSTTFSNNNSSTSTSSSSNTSAPPMMKHQLLYLAKLLGFEVDFSDYPKGNHNEFLTIVTLSTDPPQICHGFGTSTNESQNDAARNALKILSDLGLNNAKSN